MNTRSLRFVRFACGCALFLAMLLSGTLFVCGLFTTWHVHGNAEVLEMADRVRLPALLSLLASLGFILLLAGMLRMLCRLRPPRAVTAFFWGLWFFLSTAFLVVNGLQQVLDYQTVLEAAGRVAAGSYAALDQPYFHALSHQIPMLLPMEIVARLFPRFPLNRTLQLLNLAASLGCGFCLSVIGSLLFSRETGSAVRLMFFFSMPAVLYCTYVYGTVFMMAMDLAGALCFLLYEKSGRRAFGIMAGVCVGLACMAKTNGLIFVIAFSIVSALSAISGKDWRRLLPAGLAAMVCLLSTQGVILLYERRAGIHMGDSITTQARFVMGLQEGPACGWYNNYITPFISPEVSREEELEKAEADLAERLRVFSCDPPYAFRFFSEKLLSQWLDPTFGTVRYGQIAPHSGDHTEMVIAVYREDSPWYRVLSGYMKLWQCAVYFLAAVGLCFSLKRRKGNGAGIILLPVVIVGGALYHLLFEAKSAYAYPYVIYLLPYAGYGLSALLVFFQKPLGWKGGSHEKVLSERKAS